MGAFEYRQAQEMRDAFAREGVRYLFLGKSGAILLGYPDTTEDADIFPLKNTDNGRALDLDLVFAPDGIEGFGLAFKRRIEADGFPVCHPDDIIASEQAAGRAKDRESLPRLRAFAAWWLNNRTN